MNQVQLTRRGKTRGARDGWGSPLLVGSADREGNCRLHAQRNISERRSIGSNWRRSERRRNTGSHNWGWPHQRGGWGRILTPIKDPSMSGSQHERELGGTKKDKDWKFHGWGARWCVCLLKECVCAVALWDKQRETKRKNSARDAGNSDTQNP